VILFPSARTNTTSGATKVQEEQRLQPMDEHRKEGAGQPTISNIFVALLRPTKQATQFHICCVLCWPAGWRAPQALPQAAVGNWRACRNCPHQPCGFRHVPARGAWRHRRSVPGVHRARRRAERRQGAPDKCRRGDLVPRPHERVQDLLALVITVWGFAAYMIGH
jgi:hypothetical protein